MGSQFSILSQMANTFVKTVYFALFTLAYFTVEISGDERGIRSMKYYNTNFYVSVTGSGCSDWVMYNGGSEDCIQIQKFRISHHSDRNRKNNRRYEGQFHGYTVWRLFHENPSVLSSKYGMKFGGFAVKNGVTTFNSGAFNTASMVAEEQDVVDALVHAWKTDGPGKSY